jgi:hypothetical protein
VILAAAILAGAGIAAATRIRGAAALAGLVFLNVRHFHSPFSLLDSERIAV